MTITKSPPPPPPPPRSRTSVSPNSQYHPKRQLNRSISKSSLRKFPTCYVLLISIVSFSFWSQYGQYVGLMGYEKEFASSSSVSSSAASSSVSSSRSTTSNDEHGHAHGHDDDVLYFDQTAMKNARATFEGARSHIDWAANSLVDTTLADNLEQFQALPLLATVDRRPITAKKQMKLDTDNLHQNGKLLGCAVSATTFVSKVEELYLKSYKQFPVTCDVCFQFSNRKDMSNFVPGVGYEPISKYQESTATKCFGGTASVSARFVNWQSQDERFTGFGYPWTVDCTLPNGIKELTCRDISKAQNTVEYRDDLHSIYFATKFSLDGYFADAYAKTFHVFSRWPWTALQSHDDDRRKIATSLPSTWDDDSSAFVPSSYQELKFAHVEGPGYTMGTFKGTPTLESMIVDEESSGGVHFRLLANLFHLVRNAPNSTHFIAVVDGQANTSYGVLQDLLRMKIKDIYPEYGAIFSNSKKNVQERLLIPVHMMKGPKTNKVGDLTLMELLRMRKIKLHVVPIATPSLAFERSVCGGQYSFAAYLAARYAADYHVMMYVDGDTAMIEGSNKTLQEILYNRFFSKNASKCAGHRIRLIEQYVKPEDESIDRVLQCTEEVALDKDKWKYAMDNCHLKEGHIVARTDSIWAMSVHHPDTDMNFVPDGVEDCITPGNKENDRYFLKPDEFVQLHLRNRLRKDECVCLLNQ